MKGQQFFVLVSVASVTYPGLEKLGFLEHESLCPEKQFKRMFYTSKFCALCDVRRYMCLPHQVPCHVIETKSGTVVSIRTTSLTWRH